MVERKLLRRRLTTSGEEESDEASDSSVVGVSQRAASRTRGGGRVHDQIWCWISRGKRANCGNEVISWDELDIVSSVFYVGDYYSGV